MQPAQSLSRNRIELINEVLPPESNDVGLALAREHKERERQAGRRASGMHPFELLHFLKCPRVETTDG